MVGIVGLLLLLFSLARHLYRSCGFSSIGPLSINMQSYIIEHYLDLQSSLSGLLTSNLSASSNSLLALPASSGSSFKKLHANLSFQPFSFQALMLWFGNSSLISNIAISCAIKTNIFSSPSNCERLATLSCARCGSTYHPPLASGTL